MVDTIGLLPLVFRILCRSRQLSKRRRAESVD
jgi:hypothetical protein